jgi:hypothetical protein
LKGISENQPRKMEERVFGLSSIVLEHSEFVVLREEPHSAHKLGLVWSSLVATPERHTCLFRIVIILRKPLLRLILFLHAPIVRPTFPALFPHVRVVARGASPVGKLIAGEASPGG